MFASVLRHIKCEFRHFSTNRRYGIAFLSTCVSSQGFEYSTVLELGGLLNAKSAPVIAGHDYVTTLDRLGDLAW